MAIGLKYFDNADVSASREAVYAKVKSFMEGFAGRHGSCICRELLGIDLLTDEGKQAFHQQNIKELKCNRYIVDAVLMTEKNDQISSE